MRKLITLLIVLCITATGFAQSKKLESITEFKLQNSGAILNKDKDVDGYYFFYLVDKLKKGAREYGIQVLDNNLNEVAFKKYVAQKGTILVDSQFNNDGLMFAFLNKKERHIKVVLFDRNAEQKETSTVELSKKEITWLMAMNQSEDFNILTSVPNKGFLLTVIKDNKKIGYKTFFYPTDDSRGWRYGSPEGSKEIVTGAPMATNEKFIVINEMSKPGMLSKKLKITTKILNTETGKLVTTIKSDPKKPKLITNGLLNENNQLILMGEYFKGGDNIMKDKSQGLFVEVIDETGATLTENTASWSKDINPILKAKDDKKNSYIYFHDIVPTADGSFYAIGEKFRKTASAAGIAAAVLSRGGNSVTQLTITDALVFEFDKDFALKGIQTFEKGKSRAPSISDFGSPQLNAHVLKNYGAFDHIYTQIDKENDRFYACFIDYERLKGEKNKNAFKTIIYDEGEFSQDKIYLEAGKGKITRVLPAKTGNVVILEYDKKAKTMDLHMEKLNID
ncbi:hypothetical protein POV27_16320 [Aureisphaera galaxeae]|uniref:DUF6770 family protein n=1 Tax=Aureisphaera galaxeae TaxID=1538023 RepID=UPI0023503E35|nr:DUF6770 family protein [Aureisphaera galaxeae]MDC8005626.1 hypothetical protein [Aureisphaera galaxeae]